MTQAEATDLIKSANIDKTHTQKWVDLGCGSGLFSHALADLLPPESHILMVDKVNQAPIKSMVSRVNMEFLKADFTTDSLLDITFDGILMANSLHYVKKKEPFVDKLKNHLNEHGKLIIVEYDTRQSNPWVPFPIPFDQLKKLFMEKGFTSVNKLGERPSRYGEKNMYACEIGRRKE